MSKNSTSSTNLKGLTTPLKSSASVHEENLEQLPRNLVTHERVVKLRRESREAYVEAVREDRLHDVRTNLKQVVEELNHHMDDYSLVMRQLRITQKKLRSARLPHPSQRLSKPEVAMRTGDDFSYLLSKFDELSYNSYIALAEYSEPGGVRPVPVYKKRCDGGEDCNHDNFVVENFEQVCNEFIMDDELNRICMNDDNFDFDFDEALDMYMEDFMKVCLPAEEILKMSVEEYWRHSNIVLKNKNTCFVLSPVVEEEIDDGIDHSSVRFNPFPGGWENEAK